MIIKHNSQYRAVVLCCITLLGVSAPSEAESDPPLVISDGVVDSDRVRVAIVDSGVNYQLPVIKQALARNEQGEFIAYDFWDMDPLPFDRHPNSRGFIQRHGTQTASLLIQEAPFVELIPYRYPRPDMSRMRLLVEHAQAHDVRLVGMPLGGNRREDWLEFERAASEAPEILFIASAGNNGRDIDQTPVYPASLPLNNLLVVSSSDDFALIAQGSNWGRNSVDYLVPAENQSVVGFSGDSVKVSGSSYAVSRTLALASRFVRDQPDLSVDAILAKLSRHFANGAQPGFVAKGIIYDPQYDPQLPVTSNRTWHIDKLPDLSPEWQIPQLDQRQSLSIPLEVLILNKHWTDNEVTQVLAEAESILEQCGFVFQDILLKRINAPSYMENLATGPSKTLFDAVRSSGANRRLTVVFANDTNMHIAYDAEAFGQGNTRARPWLTHSVWLTHALQDRAIALAHELFHVLVNSGNHSSVQGNLMNARTNGNNRTLSQEQCSLAAETSTLAKLAKTVSTDN